MRAPPRINLPRAFTFLPCTSMSSVESYPGPHRGKSNAKRHPRNLTHLGDSLSQGPWSAAGNGAPAGSGSHAAEEDRQVPHLIAFEARPFDRSGTHHPIHGRGVVPH